MSKKSRSIKMEQTLSARSLLPARDHVFLTWHNIVFIVPDKIGQQQIKKDVFDFKKASSNSTNGNPQTGDIYEELADGEDTDNENGQYEKSQDRIKQIDQFKDLINNQSNTPR